jgi:hypothetical protein
MPTSLTEGPGRSTGLVDVLDRVLDKGLVVAGDVRIGLANVELLTIQIRLLICSIDKAEQIGLNWWRYNPYLTGTPAPAPAQQAEIARLEARIADLERQLALRTATSNAEPAAAPGVPPPQGGPEE